MLFGQVPNAYINPLGSRVGHAEQAGDPASRMGAHGCFRDVLVCSSIISRGSGIHSLPRYWRFAPVVAHSPDILATEMSAQIFQPSSNVSPSPPLALHHSIHTPVCCLAVLQERLFIYVYLLVCTASCSSSSTISDAVERSVLPNQRR